MKVKIAIASVAFALSTNAMASAPQPKPAAPYFSLDLSITPPPDNYANNMPLQFDFDVTVFNGQCTMVKNRLLEHVADLKVCGHQEPDGRFVVVTHFELKHRGIAMDRFTFSDVRVIAKNELKYVKNEGDDQRRSCYRFSNLSDSVNKDVHLQSPPMEGFLHCADLTFIFLG